MTAWLLAVAVVVTPGARVGAVFDLAWTSFARVAPRQGEQVVTSGGELAGRGTGRFVATGTPSVLRLAFSRESGAGAGLIGPDGPMAFEFPTAVRVGIPPPVPHLSGGTF